MEPRRDHRRVTAIRALPAHVPRALRRGTGARVSARSRGSLESGFARVSPRDGVRAVRGRVALGGVGGRRAHVPRVPGPPHLSARPSSRAEAGARRAGDGAHRVDDAVRLRG